MSSDIVRRLTPEEEELETKKSELSKLEAKLTERELDLATFHAELHAFEQKYQQIIGLRYAELDRIEAQIIEYTEYLESTKNFKPSEDLKKLYREVAKQIHPDLAANDEERTHRQELMIEANQAYEDGDEERLRNILNKWESSPESVQGDDIGAELIRIVRKMAQIRSRLTSIEEEFLAVQQTELYQLREQIEFAEKAGKNLLEEMAIELDQQISVSQERLEELKKRIGIEI